MSERIGQMVLETLSNDIRRLLMEQKNKLNEAEKNFGGSFNVSIPVKFGIAVDGGVKWESHVKFYLDQVDAVAHGTCTEGQENIFDAAKKARDAMDGLNQQPGEPWFPPGFAPEGGAPAVIFHCPQCDHAILGDDEEYLGCKADHCICSVCHTSSHQLTHWKEYEATERHVSALESDLGSGEDMITLPFEDAGDLNDGEILHGCSESGSHCIRCDHAVKEDDIFVRCSIEATLCECTVCAGMTAAENRRSVA